MMSRIVSMKLPVVHSPTRAPSQSRLPERASSTSWIGRRSTSATLGGMVWRRALTAAMLSSVWPNSRATAAATMTKGKIESKAR